MSAAQQIIANSAAGSNKAPSFEADDIAKKFHDQMVGKTVVITGVSPNSLGAEFARVVAGHNPKLLVLASRSLGSITQVINAIRPTASPDANIQALELDLASQESVRSAAAKLQSLTPVIDVLVNNAGVMMLPEYKTTPEGIEMHLGINHIGHFLFTNLLVPTLLASTAGPRVLNVTSAGGRTAGVRFDDWNFSDGKTYEPFPAYAQSKTANLLFTSELAKRLGPKGLLSFGVDPGLVITTSIAREVPFEVAVAQGFLLPDGSANPDLPVNTQSQAGASYVEAAYDPALKDHNGGTITSCVVDTTLQGHATDAESAKKLWDLSEELVKQKFQH
ncbi:NAD(P)-binding protein [Thozetella sp. PMI_491]|nr:NAD(P)-binding protein [Thozetella sp. PMI_491]